MKELFDVKAFWRNVLDQDEVLLSEWFWEDAWVDWPNTNERFTVEEYIQANCRYPGDWDGEIKKVITHREQVITVVQVYPKDRSCSFHVTSFIHLQQGRIATLEEYWGDDGEPPQWRKDLHIGGKIP